jgi:protein SCO1/2
MANIAVGLKKMPKDLSEQVKVVFVTTDPSRDSPNALRAWLDRFDERLIGLTGSEAAIEAAQTAAGVPTARKTVLAAGDYAVAHASFVVAYTKDNLGHLIYPSGVTQKDWAHDLPRLVNETWSSRWDRSLVQIQPLQSTSAPGNDDRRWWRSTSSSAPSPAK